jgi:hypothetical protein
MRLDFFMLADDASSPDGKVYIHGGAITRAHVPSFPAQVLVAAIARLLVDPEEIGGPSHPVSFEWVGPGQADPSQVASTDVAPIDPPGGFGGGEDVGLVVVAKMLVPCQGPGPHEVRFRMDGEVICSRRLYVGPLEAAPG